jgi:hypothetical protein
MLPAGRRWPFFCHSTNALLSRSPFSRRTAIVSRLALEGAREGGGIGLRATSPIQFDVDETGVSVEFRQMMSSAAERHSQNLG